MIPEFHPLTRSGPTKGRTREWRELMTVLGREAG